MALGPIPEVGTLTGVASVYLATGSITVTIIATIVLAALAATRRR
jgi:hypothetical protein